MTFAAAKGKMNERQESYVKRICITPTQRCKCFCGQKTILYAVQVQYLTSFSKRLCCYAKPQPSRLCSTLNFFFLFVITEGKKDIFENSPRSSFSQSFPMDLSRGWYPHLYRSSRKERKTSGTSCNRKATRASLA